MAVGLADSSAHKEEERKQRGLLLQFCVDARTNGVLQVHDPVKLPRHHCPNGHEVVRHPDLCLFPPSHTPSPRYFTCGY